MYAETLEWFVSRVGKIVFRTKVSCNCEICNDVYKNGLFLNDEDHAYYVFDVMSVSNVEGFDLKYFDSKEERDVYELKNN